MPSSEANVVSVDCAIFGLGGGGSKNFTRFEREPSGSQFIIRKKLLKVGETRTQKDFQKFPRSIFLICLIAQLERRFVLSTFDADPVESKY